MINFRRGVCTSAVLVVATGLVAGRAFALDEAANEKDVLKACEKQLCDIVAKKPASGADLSCALSKTWSKSKIQDGIKEKKLTWGFGDARCTIDVKAGRAALVDAVTKPDGTLDFTPHTVKCQVEREKELTEFSFSLAPKITFKDGKATKALLNLKDINAPAVIKSAIWTVAQAEDYFGLFHSQMVAEVNELVGQKCPKVAAGN